MRRAGAAFAAVVLLTIAVASPAAAVVSKSGSKTCYAPNSNSYTVGLANGNVNIKGPGGTTAYYVGDSTWVTRTRAGAYGGGSWFVNSDRSLNDPGTYAGCTGAV
ncbi:hypothetical protein [Cellulomonas septica]|uniref:SH3b domain-containing protein n=1 Tax=Cellulomonas septica TaxID=285080 RepID=A0ABX1JXV4_9CELL|nr:hypothetical protein [Cellulomonas septica]NKY38686.1 hypothetical protein [Cellulomonas septica]